MSQIYQNQVQANNLVHLFVKRINTFWKKLPLKKSLNPIVERKKTPSWNLFIIFRLDDPQFILRASESQRDDTLASL